MPSRDDLAGLVERVEAATGADRELDVQIAQAAGLSYDCDPNRWGWLTPHWSDGSWVGECPAYTASLDAAMTLVPEGWTWSVPGFCKPLWDARIIRAADGLVSLPLTQACATPALALCAAAIRTRLKETADDQ